MTDVALRCRPYAVQELLLDACLRDGDAAVAAWNAWRSRIDLDRIDEESFRHLPLAWHRLRGRAATDATLEIAKGVYRQAWYRNQLLLRSVGEVVDVLADEGITALLLKGAALAPRYFPALGTRPMGDLDILVPHASAARALGRLIREGWTCEKRASADRLVRHAHAIALTRGQIGLDLHWNALWAQRTPTADDLFWADARPREHEGRSVLELSPTDAFFHTCMHGARRSQNAYSWAPLPLVRWITDAFHIAQKEPIDWERIDRLARRYHARLQLFDALSYLCARGLAVPDAVLAEWSHVRSPSERLHYELALTRHAPRVFPSLPRFRFWASYRMKLFIERGEENASAMGPLAKAAGFPEYLIGFVKTDLDAKRWTGVPSQLVNKIGRRPGLLRP